MSDTRKMTFQLELVWWTFTFLLAAGVLYPILSNTNNYPFTFSNVLFIATFITLTRHIFLLKYTYLAHANRIKIIIILSTAPFVFYLVTELNYFQTFIDENSIDFFLGHLNEPLHTQLESYIHTEMILFGVGAVIAAVVLPLRLVVSLWRWKNTGEV